MRTSRLALAFLVALGLWIAIAAPRFTTSARSGLRAQYFPTIDWSGPPSRVLLDPEISTLQLSRSWGFTPPDVFSTRWSGYLFVDRPGAYTMATTSDDGSQVYIDGRLIVENLGTHGARTREGLVRFERGSHAVVLQYSQAGGGSYWFEWSWAHEQEPPTPVPAWLLSPRARGYPTLAWLRVIGWIWPVLTLACIVLGGRLAYQLGYWPRRHVDPDTRADQPYERPNRAGICLALFVMLTVVQTWPLASSPAHLSRNDNADTMLNEWTLAWVAHQLPRHPLQLFEGNAFYPEHRTLAYSEPLLVQSVMAAPLLWLGGSPVLAYNVVLLAGFTVTGWVTCLVVSRWTKDWLAGIASGAMVAFNAHTLTRLPHLQAQHAEFLPLALLMLDALLQRPRWASAVWLAVCFTLQALASIYLLVFTAVALVVGTLVRPEDWLGRPFQRVAPKLAFAAGLAGLALAPFLLPYAQLHAAGFVRSLDEVAWYAATARDYLTTPSRFHAYAGGAGALFPGAVALMLCAVAVVSGAAFADARARMCLAFGVAGVVLSFGPAVAPGYEFFYLNAPILQGIRNTSRFGYLGLVAVAVLGGYGLAVLRRRSARLGMWRDAFSIAVVALVALEPLAAPIDYQRFNAISPIYKRPASEVNAVVVEMPLAPPESPFRNAPALLNSTSNWKPLLNGYSGFVPPSYVEHYEALTTFPSAGSIAALRAIGVTDVFVDLDQFEPERVNAIEHEGSLHRVAIDGPVALYRFEPRIGGP